mgnify:CR=1 FL=1
MSDTVRLDAALVEKGLVSGRDKAKELIENGKVTVNGHVVRKAAARVADTDVLDCDSTSQRYVGRGGLKLEKALRKLAFPVEGAIAMDVGASTGGFTDCLLSRGAAHVYAIDVGHDQLHPRLRGDARVSCMEETDARRQDILCKAISLHSIDLISIDVSFISLAQIAPAVLPFLRPNGWMICLIKPQFEVGREYIGKHGVVRSRAAHRQLLDRFLQKFTAWGLSVKLLTFSPITGGDGNIEYLIAANLDAGGITPDAVPAVVEAAYRELGRKN